MSEICNWNVYDDYSSEFGHQYIGMASKGLSFGFETHMVFDDPHFKFEMLMSSNDPYLGLIRG